nr:MAG TPA: hypothetical protein [Caudoviricetes sp.]
MNRYTRRRDIPPSFFIPLYRYTWWIYSVRWFPVQWLLP